jgi:hypothetical protein
MGDTELHLLDHYINMQSLPRHSGVVVYNLWLLDNRNYQVSTAWILFVSFIIDGSYVSEVGEIFVVDSKGHYTCFPLASWSND